MPVYDYRDCTCRQGEFWNLASPLAPCLVHSTSTFAAPLRVVWRKPPVDHITNTAEIHYPRAHPA